MNVKPLNDRVLIKRVEAEEKTAGGLFIPETAKDKPQEGLVVATGPGRLEKGDRIPVAVKEGDRVLFSKYGGTEVKVNGEEHMLLREDDIYAILG